MGQGTGVPPLGRHQLLRMFPLRLLLVLCPEIPMARPGGAVGTLAEQRRDPSPGYKIFSMHGHQSRSTAQLAGRLGLGKVFPCAFAVPLHFRQS